MKRLTRGLAIAAACAAAVSGAAATSASAKTLNIVAAGDSYTSGVGGGDYYGDPRCLRSQNTYPFQYAESLRERGITVNVRNVACGGGVVPDLDGQMTAVDSSTDMVVLTIGGNDVGFTFVVVNCFLPVVADPARCRQSIEEGKAKVPNVTTAALKRLQALKARLRPGAKVVVLSYPYLANPGNYILRGWFNSYNSGKGARELGDLGDKAVIDAAAAANAQYGEDLVKFVPTKDLFVGHEPNQDPYRNNSQGWVHEDNIPAGPYHPMVRGYRAMADAMLRAGGPEGDFGLSR